MAKLGNKGVNRSHVKIPENIEWSEEDKSSYKNGENTILRRQ